MTPFVELLNHRTEMQNTSCSIASLPKDWRVFPSFKSFFSSTAYRFVQLLVLILALQFQRDPVLEQKRHSRPSFDDIAQWCPIESLLSDSCEKMIPGQRLSMHGPNGEIQWHLREEESNWGQRTILLSISSIPSRKPFYFVVLDRMAHYWTNNLAIDSQILWNCIMTSFLLWMNGDE